MHRNCCCYFSVFMSSVRWLEVRWLCSSLILHLCTLISALVSLVAGCSKFLCGLIHPRCIFINEVDSSDFLTLVTNSMSFFLYLPLFEVYQGFASCSWGFGREVFSLFMTWKCVHPHVLVMNTVVFFFCLHANYFLINHRTLIKNPWSSTFICVQVSNASSFPTEEVWSKNNGNLWCLR